MTGKSIVIHASAVAVDDHAILIRGESGSGKSALARQLIQLGAMAGRRTALVADDRSALIREEGRIIVSPVPAGAGLLEVRGVGIVRVPFRTAVMLALVVDLDSTSTPRLPEPEERAAEILGLRQPRIVVNGPENALLVLWRLGIGDDAFVT